MLLVPAPRIDMLAGLGVKVRSVTSTRKRVA